MNRKDLLISVLPKENNELKQIEELNFLRNEIIQVLVNHNYKFLIADEEAIVAVNNQELQDTLTLCKNILQEKLSVSFDQNLHDACVKLDKFIK